MIARMRGALRSRSAAVNAARTLVMNGCPKSRGLPPISWNPTRFCPQAAARTVYSRFKPATAWVPKIGKIDDAPIPDMPPLTQLPAWQALRDHQSAAAAFHPSELFARDPARFEHLALRCGDLLLDLSKNLVTAETLRLLLDLARQSELSEWIARMFRGDRVNSTENRAALHIALRASGPVMLEGKDMTREVAHTLDRMRRFCEGVRSTQITGFSGHPFTDIVNIGIGGSDLGPALAAEALAPYASPQLRAHFVSNVDGAHLAGVLAELNPESTLFVVASKTFTT